MKEIKKKIAKIKKRIKERRQEKLNKEMAKGARFYIKLTNKLHSLNIINEIEAFKLRKYFVYEYARYLDTKSLTKYFEHRNNKKEVSLKNVIYILNAIEES